MKIPVRKNKLDKGKKNQNLKKMGKLERELKFLERNV